MKPGVRIFIVLGCLLGLPAGLLWRASAGERAAKWPASSGAMRPEKGDAADQAMASIRPEAIQAHMRFLADDALEGRMTGTRGYELAAKYMATEFEQLGLQPAGDNASYFQIVPYRKMSVDGERTSLTLSRDGKEEKFAFRKDFIASGDPGRPESSIDAPVVFVGYGVTSKEKGYDDYKGIDAQGKIVALFFGAPNFESSLKAHYSSFETKLANAVEHGAVGLIVLDDPVLEQMYGFNKQVRDLTFGQLRWLDKERRPNDYFPELKGGAFLNMASTKRFFEGSGHTAEEVFAATRGGKAQAFDMKMTASIRNATELSDTRSANIVSKLEGSDARLKNEYVVFTAHLDHLGIGEAENGDSIYNGALDNASGSAILLELAKAFAGMNPRPKRSLLFVSVAAEEEGLLGSDYFVHYPTVPKGALVADVNMDEDVMLWPVQDIIAFGAEHSSLANVVERAGTRAGLSLSPDPIPDEVVFIRSDQYSFVKQGIPALFPIPGFKSSDPNIRPMEIFQHWEETRYHHPGDDMQQPGLDFNQAARYARFMFLCGYLVAEDSQRPTWNKGDFFGDLYGKK